MRSPAPRSQYSTQGKPEAKPALVRQLEKEEASSLWNRDTKHSMRVFPEFVPANSRESGVETPGIKEKAVACLSVERWISASYTNGLH